jgi:hypothetical protein
MVNVCDHDSCELYRQLGETIINQLPDGNSHAFTSKELSKATDCMPKTMCIFNGAIPCRLLLLFEHFLSSIKINN